MTAHTEFPIIAVSKITPTNSLTHEKLISTQLQFITLGADESTGDRRLLYSLQQCTRNFYNPIARLAAQSTQVSCHCFIISY